MFVMAHSAAGMFMAPLAFKCAGGLVLLACTFNWAYTEQRYVSLEDWTRPVMLLQGDLDGQMKWFHNVPYAVDAAISAAKIGPTYAATYKSFVLVRGMNHGQMSNNVANLARGDVRATADYGTATHEAGAAIAAFVTAHHATRGGPAQQEAAEQLLALQRGKAARIAPYAAACGFGDVMAAYGDPGRGSSNPSSRSTSTSGLLLPGGLLQGSCRETGSCESGAVHPGVLLAAEQFAVSTQSRVLSDSALPPEALARVRVVASAHTDLDSLLYNQPAIMEQPDGKLVVHVHVYLHFRRRERTGQMPFLRPVAPEYWLKLKTSTAVAQALGLPMGAAAAPAELTAEQVNQGTMERASSMLGKEGCPALAAGDGRGGSGAGGAVLKMEQDVDWMEHCKAQGIEDAALSFVLDSRVTFKEDSPPSAVGANANSDGNGGGGKSTSSRVVSVRSPVIESPLGTAEESRVQQAANFRGNLYMKVLSVGQAMEWLLLDGFRDTMAW